jgi:DNA-binding transcriptional LysR family regulator
MVAGYDLIRLFPDLSVTRSYWTVWHENLRVARRVQAFADLLDRIVREERGLFRAAP